MEQLMDSDLFSTPKRGETLGKSRAPPRRAVIDYWSSDWSRAERVCVAVVMADLFTCRKYLELTHMCGAPVSAATRLL